MNIIYIMITNKIKYMLHECYIISANNDTINLSAISLSILCEKCLHCYRKKIKLKRIHRLSFRLDYYKSSCTIAIN